VLELWNLGPFLALQDVERKCLGLHSDGVFHGQSLKVLPLEPMRQYAMKLMGHAGGDPKILEGESLNKQFEELKNGADHQWMMRWVYLFSMKLAYLFGDLDLAESHSQNSSELFTTGAISLTYKCLVLLGQARRGKRKHRNIRKARSLLKKVEKLSAGCPENFLGKQCLLEAELAWTQRKIAKAQSRFRLAILQSRDQGFWLEEALANEQLGKLYLEQKGNEEAIAYLQEAQRVYERWGANAKVQHIESLYGALWRC
jgi:tetratricopeptide (TPR) repeat protein